jgi:hypothetical protein
MSEIRMAGAGAAPGARGLIAGRAARSVRRRKVLCFFLSRKKSLLFRGKEVNELLDGRGTMMVRAFSIFLGCSRDFYWN